MSSSTLLRVPKPIVKSAEVASTCTERKSVPTGRLQNGCAHGLGGRMGGDPACQWRGLGRTPLTNTLARQNGLQASIMARDRVNEDRSERVHHHAAPHQTAVASSLETAVCRRPSCSTTFLSTNRSSWDSGLSTRRVLIAKGVNCSTAVVPLPRTQSIPPVVSSPFLMLHMLRSAHLLCFPQLPTEICPISC